MRILSRLYFGLALVSLLTCISASAQSDSTAYDLVDPMIGSDGGGNTFPGPSLPFGMMQWSPDTNHNAWYFYNEKQIDGFSLTHISGAGCALYGDFGVLPTTAAYAITMPPPEQEGARAYTGKSVPEVALWAAEHI